MINYVSGYAYSGRNAAMLAECGFGEDDAFVTFKQAVKLPGLTGKKLKGIKKAATLVRFSKTETEIDPETGKERAKPIYFSVFNIADVLARK